MSGTTPIPKGETKRSAETVFPFLGFQFVYKIFKKSQGLFLSRGFFYDLWGSNHPD